MAEKRPPSDASAAARRHEAIAFLLGRINYERTAVVPYGRRQLKLDRMRQLLNRLGNPDAGLPIVHVAGTKGKGSTAAMIAAMLHAAGYETGLFSSPHLEKIEERFAVNGVPCSAAALVGLVDQVRPVVLAMDRESTGSAGSMSPTYFELTSALALMYFAQQHVDIGVLEVGLGGRLDATNVCQPAVAVITSISLDHTRQLGTTLAQIAAEKAGIIKPGVPILCGRMNEEPQEIIAEIARQHGCRMFVADRDFRHRYHPPQRLATRDEPGRLDVEGDLPGALPRLPGVPLRLLGEHQAANAALAVATVAELRRQGWLVSTAAVRTALGSLALPGRVEIVARHPTVVLDVAHNVASAEALAEVLRVSFGGQRRTLLLAVSRDKDVRGIVQALLPHFDRIVATEYRDNPRAVSTATLARIVRDEARLRQVGSLPVAVEEQPDPLAAWELVQQRATPEELICVTGSFFIAAELRGALLASGMARSAASVESFGPRRS